MPPDPTRDLVLKYGTNAATYQIVNPVIDKWFPKDQNAVVGYVDRRHIRVLAGRPVCPPDQTQNVVEELNQATDKELCIFNAESTNVPGFNGQPLCIGSQPLWDPAVWEETVLADASLRQQFNRARNKGVVIEEWDTAKATNNPELQNVLDQWLQGRGLPPLSFLVEPQTLSFLEDRRTFVAVQNGKPMGFLTLCPIPRRNGWLTEQFPRHPQAPNGTVDLLMHEAALTLARENYSLLTMGMVPLAPHTRPKNSDAPKIVRLLLAWVYAHGRRFYNFDGLYWFKNKFHPHSWEDLYLIPQKGQVGLRHLVATSEAFTTNRLEIALPRILYRAIRQELKWLLPTIVPEPKALEKPF